MTDVVLCRVSDGGRVMAGPTHAAALLEEKDESGQPLYTLAETEEEFTVGGCASCQPTGWKPKKKEKVEDNA